MHFKPSRLFNAALAVGMFAFTQTSLAAKKEKTAPALQGVPALKITSGNPAAVKGGILTYEAYESANLNPITFRDAGAIELLTKWAFESLVDSDVVTDEPIPQIAKSWKISDDGKEFTFQIDERARWFDGKPITVEDVKFSFEVFAMPGANSPLRKSQWEGFEKAEIVNPTTIKFIAKKRLFSNFGFLTNTLIIPKHLYFYSDPKKMDKNEYTKIPKGSGPYILEKIDKGSQAVLKRNPNWWGSVLPQNQNAYNFDKIVIKFIRDPQIAFETFKKGDLDMMPLRIGNTQLWRQTQTAEPFVKGLAKALPAASNLQEGYGFIGFNLRNELFQNREVRKALAMAINKEELINKSLDGLAVIPRGPLFSVSNYNGKWNPAGFDPKGASAILAKAGWKDTDGDYILEKDGKKFEFTIIVPNARIEKELLFIQNYWKQIGVTAKIKIMEFSSWIQLQNERKFEACANGKGRTMHERAVDPYSEWHSDNIPAGLNNWYGYSNPKVDKLIVQGREEMDFAKRKKFFTEANDIIADEYPIVQYSESKFPMFVVNTKVVLPEYKGKNWYPFALGDKYWFKK